MSPLDARVLRFVSTSAASRFEKLGALQTTARARDLGARFPPLLQPADPRHRPCRAETKATLLSLAGGSHVLSSGVCGLTRMFQHQGFQLGQTTGDARFNRS